MNNEQQATPDAIANIALELTKMIASTENASIKAPMHRDPKAFYFELYTECHKHVKKTTSS